MGEGGRRYELQVEVVHGRRLGGELVGVSLEVMGVGLSTAMGEYVKGFDIRLGRYQIRSHPPAAVCRLRSGHCRAMDCASYDCRHLCVHLSF